jgi:hypothetical protein
VRAVAGSVWAYCRKIVSWVLIFNCLLCIFLAVGFLVMFYGAHWKLYEPFLLSANLLWAPVLASVLSFFPIASFGQVKVRRLGVHHFVYGFVIVGAASVFMSVSFLSLFVINIRDVRVNVGRVFVLVGLTLIVDDLADISERTRLGLLFLKSKVYGMRRAIHAVQGLLSLATLSVFSCILVWLTQNPRGLNLANIVFEGSMLVTGLTGVGSVGKKVWLRIRP